MNVQILTVEKEIFHGEVDSITLPGLNGLFQILDNHIPIISILISGKIILKKYDKILDKFNKKNIKIKGGILEVNHNKVSILCD